MIESQTDTKLPDLLNKTERLKTWLYKAQENNRRIKKQVEAIYGDEPEIKVGEKIPQKQEPRTTLEHLDFNLEQLSILLTEQESNIDRLNKLTGE